MGKKHRIRLENFYQLWDATLEIISVIIGGLLVIAGQWIASRQSAKIEVQKLKQDELKEVRRDIVKFREERARPILEALDRVANSWSVDSYVELAENIGIESEKIDTNSEEYRKMTRGRKKQYFEQMQKDISSASVIHDPVLRKAVNKVLWLSLDPDAILQKGDPTLQEVYQGLEDWIFNPQSHKSE